MYAEAKMTERSIEVHRDRSNTLSSLMSGFSLAGEICFFGLPFGEAVFNISKTLIREELVHEREVRIEETKTR